MQIPNTVFHQSNKLISKIHIDKMKNVSAHEFINWDAVIASFIK